MSAEGNVQISYLCTFPRNLNIIERIGKTCIARTHSIQFPKENNGSAVDLKGFVYLQLQIRFGPVKEICLKPTQQ